MDESIKTITDREQASPHSKEEMSLENQHKWFTPTKKAKNMGKNEYKVGQEVKILPTSDWFMKGERHAKIIKIEGELIEVKGGRSGQKWIENIQNIMPT